MFCSEYLLGRAHCNSDSSPGVVVQLKYETVASNPKPQTPDSKLQTPNSKPQTPNPKPGLEVRDDRIDACRTLSSSVPLYPVAMLPSIRDNCILIIVDTCSAVHDVRLATVYLDPCRANARKRGRRRGPKSWSYQAFTGEEHIHLPTWPCFFRSVISESKHLLSS